MLTSELIHINIHKITCQLFCNTFLKFFKIIFCDIYLFFADKLSHVKAYLKYHIKIGKSSKFTRFFKFFLLI